MMRSVLAQACRPYTLLHQRLHPGLRILMYHRVASLPQFDQLTVSPARFARQIERLAATHRVVALAEGLRELDQERLRQPLVAVTFDDGYCDNLTEALPILQRYGVPATIFVTTRFCDQVEHHSRYAHTPERLHLNWDEVARLAATPGITIGSHTIRHPHLPALPLQQAREEIVQSRAIIAARISRAVDFFCYPSGDFGARELRLAREAGYRAAVSVAPGENHASTDPMQLRRTEITDRDDDRAFGLKLVGAFDPLHALLHAMRRRRFANRRVDPALEPDVQP